MYFYNYLVTVHDIIDVLMKVRNEYNGHIHPLNNYFLFLHHYTYYEKKCLKGIVDHLECRISSRDAKSVVLDRVWSLTL